MYHIPKPSSLKVITGPMFSGKSEELIRLIHRAAYNRRRHAIKVIKPAIDSRTDCEIASRKCTNTGDTFEKFVAFPAEPIASQEEFMELIKQPMSVLAIDETQFFEPWLVDCIAYALDPHHGLEIDIIAAGLDMDAWRRPFGIMPQLMAIADKVEKLTAICFSCGAEALFTQKLVRSSIAQQIEIGDADIYHARCRRCHSMPDGEDTTDLIQTRKENDSEQQY